MQTYCIIFAIVVCSYVDKGESGQVGVSSLSGFSRTGNLKDFERKDGRKEGEILYTDLQGAGFELAVIEKIGEKIEVRFLKANGMVVKNQVCEYSPNYYVFRKKYIPLSLFNTVQLQNIPELASLGNNGVITSITITKPEEHFGEMNWIDNDKYVTFQFFSYTSDPRVEVNLGEPKILTVTVNEYTYEFTLIEAVKWPAQISLTSEGTHIQLKLFKESEKPWKNYGRVELIDTPPRSDNNKKFCDAVIVSVARETDDSCFIKMKYNKNMYNYIGVARHVYIKRFVPEVGKDEQRPYTSFPLLPAIQANGQWRDIDTPINLMVKKYNNGKLSQYLCERNAGDIISITYPWGQFNTAVFKGKSIVNLFAGGSGITPMIAIIVFVLQTSMDTTVYLKYFNKTLNHIMAKEKLQTLEATYPDRFKLEHIISDLNSDWTGRKGHITKNMFEEFHPKSKEARSYLCVCGPFEFSKQVKGWLQDMGYSVEHYFLFMGHI